MVRLAYYLPYEIRILAKERIDLRKFQQSLDDKHLGQILAVSQVLINQRKKRTLIVVFFPCHEDRIDVWKQDLLELPFSGEWDFSLLKRLGVGVPSWPS